MTGATFRALRTLLGYDQEAVARTLGVSKKTVSRWESGYFDIPDTVIEWLSMWLERSGCIIDAALDAAKGADCVHLTYYRTQLEYDKAGRDAGNYHLANANARRVADALMAQGIDVVFGYPGDDADPKIAKEVTR